MNEWMQQYWTFYHAGVFIFLVAGLALIFRFLILRKKKKQPGETKLSFKHWNERFNKDFEQLELEMRKFPHLPKEAVKLLKKAYKKEQKKEKKEDSVKENKAVKKIREELAKGTSTEEVLKYHSNRIYVLNFFGNKEASQVEQFREEISFLLQVAQPADEVVVKLNSPGGVVQNYGLASSQIARLRQHEIKCTVCVDLVAASGGYMMAAVADKIVAAPFAIIGSIGVAAGLPNFHRILKKNEVDYFMFTAGKYKRTVTPLTEVTEEGQEKMQQDLESIHQSFKKLIADHRKEIDIEEVATGEFWLAEEAKEKGLVDEILTSDDYLFDKMKDFEIIEITTEDSRNRIEKLLQGGIELFQSFGRRTSLEDSEIPGLIR